MAADFAKFNSNFEVMGGFISPVSDAYKKAGLAQSNHRLRMCELAVSNSSDWIMVDDFEAIQAEYMPTALVLDHFDKELNENLMIVNSAGKRVKVSIKLLAGADLIQTMSTPGVWSDADLDHILGIYGSFIVERTGTDVDEALASLQRFRSNIEVISQLIQNDVSSTKIRMLLRREMSVRYLIPQPVIQYIEENGLYMDEAAASISAKGKAKGTDSSGRDSPAIESSASKS